MRSATRILLCTFLPFAWISTILCTEFDFTVDVPPGKTECYFQTVDNNKYKTMEIDYQVIDGGDLDVNFMVRLGSEVLVSDVKKSDATHRIELKQLGDYELCFDNTFSQQSRKLVFFEIFFFDEYDRLDDVDPSKFGSSGLPPDHTEVGVTIGDFHASANRIKDYLNKMEYHQALMRAYEARDRAIMNANFDRVTFWSIVNSIVLILVGSIQVFMIRSLFEDNSKVGRLLRRGD